METQSKKSITTNGYVLDTSSLNVNDFGLPAFTREDMATVFKTFFQQIRQPGLYDLLTGFKAPAGKESFLVFKHNKYITVPTEKIALFHVKYESSMIMCLDRQEYAVNRSLEQIQSRLPEKQFYRLNRQFLVNFSAIKEVEHYFARKLLVNLVVPVADKLLVPKEKVRHFLDWMENR
jgi:two-component system response regulator LytT